MSEQDQNTVKEAKMEKKKIILVSVGNISEKYAKKIRKMFQYRKFDYVRHSTKKLFDLGTWNLFMVPLTISKKYGFFGQRSSVELDWLLEQDLSEYDVVYVFKSRTKYKDFLDTPFRFKYLTDFVSKADFKSMVETRSRDEMITAKSLAEGKIDVSEVSISVDDADLEPIEEHMRYDPSQILTAIKEIEESAQHNANQVKTLQEELTEQKKLNETMIKEREELQRKLKKLEQIKNASTKNEDVVEAKKGLIDRIVSHTKKYSAIKKAQAEAEEAKSEYVPPRVELKNRQYRVIWTDHDGVKQMRSFGFKTAAQRKKAMADAQKFKNETAAQN